MNFWKKLPFIGRLLITASIALMVAGGMMLFVSAHQEALEIHHDLEITLSKELETLPAALAETVVVGDFATLQQTLDRYVNRPLIVFASFRDTSGTRLQSIAAQEISVAPDWFIATFNFSEIKGYAPVIIGGRKYGDLELRISGTSLIDRIWTHLQNHIIILVVAIGIDFLGIWFVLRSGLKPIHNLESAADKIEQGDLNVRVPVDGSPEFQHVSQAFNNMAGALQQRMAELETILENSSVAITFAKDRKLLWCNQRMTDLFGYTFDEMRGKSTRMYYFSDQDFESIGKDVYSKILDGSRYSREILMLHKNGNKVWIRLSAKAIKANHLEEGSIWVLENIDQQKNYEQKLISAREAAEAANIAKSRFLATMSHEIRTPMNGILGMAQLLLLMPDLKENEKQDCIQVILNSGQTLLSLLNDILDLSKIEEGKIEFHYVAIRPKLLIEEVAKLFGESIRSKKLSLEVFWHGDLNAEYLSDPIRLRQMLSNLVNNAIKFTESGCIRIEGREIESLEKGKVKIEFSVSDNGIGIPQDKLDLLFKPFSQIDSSNTRKYGGTGLGLSIVQNLALLMHGDVGVTSEENKGSRFWFYVQAERASNRF